MTAICAFFAIDFSLPEFDGETLQVKESKMRRIEFHDSTQPLTSCAILCMAGGLPDLRTVRLNHPPHGPHPLGSAPVFDQGIERTSIAMIRSAEDRRLQQTLANARNPAIVDLHITYSNLGANLSTINKAIWLFSHPEFRQRPLTVLSRMAKWEWHRLSSRPARLQLDQLKLIARPFDGNGRLICYFGEKFDGLFEFLKQFLKPGMICVDVGANIGSHAVNAGRLVGETGKVYAFEADPETCAILKQNVALNQLDNIIVKNECVLDKEGYITLYINKDSGKNSVLLSRSSEINRTITVHGDTLDNALSKSRKVDLLKIDVEGADFRVLRGAEKIFQINPPSIVVIEIHDVDSDNVNSKEVLQFLQSHNYEIYSYKNNRLLPHDYPRERGNVYAVHSTAVAMVAQLI
jgi:FkbM family methyltransferase